MKHPRQFKKKRWSLKRIFLPLILAGIVGLNLYSLQAERIAGNPMPMPFEYGAAVVLSDSMAPVLSSGDVVIVRQTDTFDIGDIVVYQSGRSLVVHRVIAIEGDTITTKGDANNAADAPFQRSTVKGVVVCSVPYIGYVIQLAKTPVGVLVVIAAAVLLLELSFRADKRQEEDELEDLKEEIRRLQEHAEDKDTE